MNYKLLSMAILAWLSLSHGFSFGSPFSLERTFEFSNANDIAIHPTSGNLFITSGGGVFEVTPLGETVSSFTIVTAGNVQGLTFLPNGNLLLLGQGPGAMVQEYTPTGGVVDSGISFPTTPESVNSNGIAYNASTNTVFLSDGANATIYEYSLMGELLLSFLTTDAVPSLLEPKGVAVDPWSDNLIIVDSGLHEFSTTGHLLNTVRLADVSNLGIPEGIAIDPDTRTLFIAFGQQNVVGVFQFGAFGISLTSERTFEFINASGIAIHPTSGNLFITSGSGVSEVTPLGTVVSSFATAGIGNVQGLTFQPNGNLLLLIQGAETVIREYTTAGIAVDMGVLFRIAPAPPNSNESAYNSLTNTIFVSGGDNAMIYEYSLMGELLSSFLTTDTVSSLRTPKGLTVNPPNGNLLIVDNNSLYEFSTTGHLINAVRLSALSNLGTPEGIAIDPDTRTLFIAFGQQNVVSVFQLDGDAEGISLMLERIFHFGSASGIDFNPVSGNLFIADGIGQKVDIFEVTPLGEAVSSFSTTGLGNVQGLTFLPNGNLLLPFQGAHATIREYTTTGVAVGTGVNFPTAPDAIDIDGIAYNSLTNTIFAANDDGSTIYEYSLSGLLLSSFRTTDTVARFRDPEGLTINPSNGNLIIASDGDLHPIQPSGSSSLYELTATGLLVNAVQMPALSGLGDPEGVTIDPATRTMFIAFDQQNIVGVFRFKGLGSPAPAPPSMMSVRPVTELGIQNVTR